MRLRFWIVGLLLQTQVFALVTYQDVKPLIDSRCAICHKGPYLDLRTFPFFSDTYDTQEELLEVMIQKTERTDLKRMPPVSYPALLPEEIQLLKDWQRDGVT